MQFDIKLIIKNVILALNRIHVRGEDAELLGGAIKALKSALTSIEETETEAKGNDHHDEQGKNV